VSTPLRPHVILFDGHCRFCIASAARLERLARAGTIEALSFHDDGVLERFPGVSHEACMEALHLVTPDGRVFRGAEAIVRTLRTRRLLGALALVYYVPGIHWLTDLTYDVVAENRYRLFGRSGSATCHDGACSVPGRAPPTE